jgi:transposase
LSLGYIVKELQQHHNVIISETALRRYMKDNGFSFKMGDPYQPLRERADIIKLTMKHIRIKLENRLSDTPLEEIYLDESYVHQFSAHEYSWFHKEDGNGIRHRIGKGNRYIIVAAGGAQGWIEGSKLVFKAKDSKTEDYHTNMNNAVFIKWFKEKLLPHLRGPSLIIMDNAKYHGCKQHNLNSMSKEQLRDLLLDYKQTNSTIKYSNRMKKDDLKAILRPLVPKNSVIEDLAVAGGHKILWLPPYHPELNPIEKMWGIAKRHVADTYNDLSDKEQLKKRMRDGLNLCTPIQWSGAVRRTMASEVELSGGDDNYENMKNTIKNSHQQDYKHVSMKMEIELSDSESESDDDGDMDTDMVYQDATEEERDMMLFERQQMEEQHTTKNTQ